MDMLPVLYQEPFTTVTGALLPLLWLVAGDDMFTAPSLEGATELSVATTTPSQSAAPSTVKWSVQTVASTLPLVTTLPTDAPATVTHTVAPAVVTVPVTHHIVPWIPSEHHHQGTRWGPYFEEGADPQNVTARVGSTVRLDCKIGLLHGRTVSTEPTAFQKQRDVTRPCGLAAN
jgi:hypothetical protein